MLWISAQLKNPNGHCPLVHISLCAIEIDGVCTVCIFEVRERELLNITHKIRVVVSFCFNSPVVGSIIKTFTISFSHYTFSISDCFPFEVHILSQSPILILRSVAAAFVYMFHVYSKPVSDFASSIILPFAMSHIFFEVENKPGRQ